MEKKDKYNLAVVGVGAVGVEMLRCLKERNFPLSELRVFARSDRDIEVDGNTYNVKSISAEGFEGIDIALFAGTEGEKGASVQYAAEAINQGAVVIDNGGDFRLKEGVPLVVPEVNREKIKEHNGLIANPNCTTIQMVVALNEIYKRFGLSQIILTSFQATSGAGKGAAKKLWDETKDIVEKNKNKDFDSLEKKLKQDEYAIFPNQMIFNLIPKIGSFKENDYTTEEEKTVKETHKIFGDSSIKITSTCVRVPVFTSHSEAIYFETNKDTELEDIRNALKDSQGVIFFENSQELIYPLDTEGKNEVFIGRLRKDPFNKNCFWIWCVSDNLRKGASLNAVQIAENLISLL